MEDPEGGPRGPGTLAEIMTQIQEVAATQLRMEAALAEIRGELLAGARGGGKASLAVARPPRRGGTKASASEVHRAPVSIARASSFMAHTESRLDVPPSLPSSWPASLLIRELRKTPIVSRTQFFGGDETPRRGRRETFEDGGPMSLIQYGDGRLGKIMLDPNSWLFVVYSIVSLTLVVHDLCIVPFMVAWDRTLSGLLLATSWVSCCFWTADVGVGCITGYNNAGRLELRPSFVARRYAQSWLLPDAAVTLADWVGLILSGGGTRGARHLAKTGQLLRLLGLVRMRKAVKIVGDRLDNTFADAARVSLRVLSIVCAVLWVVHLLGCTWYFIGHVAPTDTGMRWVETTWEWNGREIRFADFDTFHQYITSIHWSMMQLGVSEMVIDTHNSWERAFSMLCLAIGLVFGSALVSTLSASMVKHHMERSDQFEKLRLLRRFLQENKVDRGLATLVQQQARQRLAAQSEIQEEDVLVLQLLPAELRRTLRFERFREHLCMHRLFRLWIDMDVALGRRICMVAMDSSAIASSDELFLAGTSTGAAYCVMSGSMTYTQEPTTAPVPEAETVAIDEDQWFCEAALWSHWVHVGTAKAQTNCSLLSLNGEALVSVLEHHPLVNQITGSYCQLFHARISAAQPPVAPWPTDLSVPLTDYGDLVVCMENRHRVAIGLTALSRGRKHAAVETSLNKLKQEVQRGQSCVMLDAEGQVERVTSVVVLRLSNLCGDVLAELGKQEADDPELRVRCQLPAVKQQAGEAAEATLARLLARVRLRPDDVETLTVHRETEVHRSQEYGVITKYLRTIHHLRISSDLPLLVLMSDDSDGEAEHHPDFPSGSVFKIQGDDKVVFCAWLDGSRFEHYASPAAEKDLTAQLSWLSEHGTFNQAI